MLSEKELIAGLKENREESVTALINLYGDRLLRVAAGITGDRQLAEEVVQDTFLTVCRKISSFREEASLGTWLFRITANLAKNKIRGGWLKRVTALDDHRAGLLGVPPEDWPEEAAIRREKSEEVNSCLKRLPAGYRDVLALYYLEELSVREVSSILRQPEGTVKSKLSRGRTLLRAELERRGVAF